MQYDASAQDQHKTVHFQRVESYLVKGNSESFGCHLEREIKKSHRETGIPDYRMFKNVVPQGRSERDAESYFSVR